MKLVPATLRGAFLVEVEPVIDERGWFARTFSRDEFAAHGLDPHVEQCSHSVTHRRGTLRGLHYQLHNPQGKLVHVTRGAVFDVAVDIRRSSPTFGQWFGTELSAENHRQMWVPPNFAHGFVVLSEQADFVYKVTANYAPADERGILWNDPDLAIAWPITGEPTLSKKDAAAATLKTAELPP